MNIQTAVGPAHQSMIPEEAPFSLEQRAWLNGFFSGLLSLDASPGATPAGTLPEAEIGRAHV